ncbi:MAG: hypothetical protein CMJ84_12770 [Planctomycetes bacterium]|jgi:hypothetical protein|nr:hypothetical protein [Planctomycetota bacterium]
MVKKTAKKKTKTKAKTTAKATAKAKKKTSRKTASKKKPVNMIISKSRTKATAGINVSGDFYSALDEAVRNMIWSAEQRATQNGRRTLRPHDL